MYANFQEKCNYIKLVNSNFVRKSNLKSSLHQVLIWQRHSVIIFISGWSFPGTIPIITIIIIIIIVVVVVANVVAKIIRS